MGLPASSSGFGVAFGHLGKRLSVGQQAWDFGAEDTRRESSSVGVAVELDYRYYTLFGGIQYPTSEAPSPVPAFLV